jgi:hypothetical protein
MNFALFLPIRAYVLLAHSTYRSIEICWMWYNSDECLGDHLITTELE